MGGEEQKLFLAANFVCLLCCRSQQPAIVLGQRFSPHPPTPYSPQIRVERDGSGKVDHPNLRGEGEPEC